MLTLRQCDLLSSITIAFDDMTLMDRLARISGRHGMVVYARGPRDPERCVVSPTTPARVEFDSHIGDVRQHSKFAQL